MDAVWGFFRGDYLNSVDFLLFFYLTSMELFV
ncbi:hypothetical protein XOCgx_0670 [Xanthomonas oryzae pv. oryzicola]|nr:hypothetical protein XOCgx_0670 [Xanthomonas oryzae pv. oryzicola]